MKQFFRRMLKFLTYAGAVLVVVLAIAVGLFRLFLPKLPEYQEDIKRWADEAIGMQVEFSAMNARWRLSGPELNFYDAALKSPESEENLLEASEISVGVGLVRLLRDRTLVVDRILVRETTLDIVHSADGEVVIQGMSGEDIADLIPASSGTAGDVEFIGQDIAVLYHRSDDATHSFNVGVVEASSANGQLRVEAALDLPDELGSRLNVSADQGAGDSPDTSGWQVYVDGRSLDLANWSKLQLVDMAAVSSGSADFSVWMELADGELDKATANIAIDDLNVESPSPGAPFDVDGRIEFSRTANGYLVAAENFRMSTVDREWPASSIQVQVDVDSADQSAQAVIANATFVRLNDIRYLLPWFPQGVRTLYEKYDPTGEVRDLRADVVGLGTDQHRFDVSAQLADAGIAVSDDLPGVRGFTGSVRANLSGGRLEFDSRNLLLNVPEFVSEPLVFDDAIGTIIWRRSNDGVIVLSDSVRLRNADFDSQSSLQVRMPADGSSPIVDLDSRWSINDIASAKRFLPGEVMSPALYRWLNDALVSGVVTTGTTILNGPLDKFPFDGGEGQFRVDARLENATLQYANLWPAAQFRSLDLVVDGVHFYSNRNVAANAGNNVSNANIEIRDLRNPVLTIDAFATGTLETIRDFSRRSPIAAVFGGQLDSVRVGGDASFNFLLTYPLRDRANFDFSTRIQSSDGSISVLGFDAPITNLNGIVNISRDSISSESLFGRFLGEQIDIDLTRADESMPSTSVIASVTGVLNSKGLTEELGLPLGDNVTGAAPYEATIKFPRAGEDGAVPLQIAVTSDLEGININLPAPLSKPRDDKRPVAAVIEFPETGHIVSAGSLDEELKWSVDFRNDGEGWDFDRGTLVSGGGYPGEPDTRGLHIRGRSTGIHLNDWLDVARNGGDGPGIGGRIRSIDLSIDNLYLFGQHMTDHRVVVQRSANEWLAEISGEQATGSVTIPYDLPGDRPIILDMKTLILPGGDETSDDSELDPRNLAAISFHADEFALGERYLGAVQAEFLRTADGLRATGLKFTDASFTIEGDAGWIADPLFETGQRSYMTVKLKSQDVQLTMQRLNYQPGIDSKDMEMDVDVNWPGGPSEDFVERLDGEIAVRFGAGQLVEVEPGAGRIFGLMSVVALPRRLSLDFRDVLEKGFGFDEISGTFRINEGSAYTCDLSLKGPAADIGIAGRAGLASRDYEQTAIVSANVGNTLPIVGAVVAGPQVAAALLIFSQIFKKPLKEMGQIYYGIDGSFDDPIVEVANAERFALSNETAGCLVAQ